jgi:hypothetical protein
LPPVLQGPPGFIGPVRRGDFGDDRDCSDPLRQGMPENRLYPGIPTVGHTGNGNVEDEFEASLYGKPMAIDPVRFTDDGKLRITSNVRAILLNV